MLAALSVTATIAIVAAATPTAAESIAGDVNSDGVVNSIDAFHLLQFRAGIICSIDDEDCQTWISHNFREKADVSDDGIENVLDAVLILQFHAGLLESLANAP